MADRKGPDDSGQDPEQRESGLVSHFKVDEELIGRSIVYSAAPPPRPPGSRRFRLPFLHRRSRAR
jgi:hypothetical protein